MVRVKEHCIKKRLRWSDCLARMTCKESEFYEDLVTYLRKNQAVCVPSEETSLKCHCCNSY